MTNVICLQLSVTEVIPRGVFVLLLDSGGVIVWPQETQPGNTRDFPIMPQSAKPDSVSVLNALFGRLNVH